MSPWQYVMQANQLSEQIRVATPAEAPALKQALAALLDAWAQECPACDLARFRVLVAS